jgi:non-specific serine/threonine protein kinase/serine/threonine-protein kinase
VEPTNLSGSDWRRLCDLFNDAQELPEVERKAFLDRALESEPTLRAEMDSLMASAATVDAFLAPRERSETRASSSATDAPGSMVGAYRIVQLLGEGGFGLVYLAEQEGPIRRRVALKLIKPGMDTRQVIARFDAERQTLAIMDHPSIAQVFDAGETEAGRPFFVMEYVPGVPITAFCDAERLPIRERLDLFLDVCDAVQHAHQKGVIHRDLKPSNIIVARRDGAPALKVIDFGIVKAMASSPEDRSFVTREGMVLGTLGYMSPEQAGAVQAEVDTRSDIYSLGVLLYELLSGEMPFDRVRLRRAGWSEAARILREEDPPSMTGRLTRARRASAENERLEESGHVTEIASRRAVNERTLFRELHGDLEWITLRALEKEPERRYASVSELAGDVRRHLANEPVLARAPSTMYRVRKFARRNRVGVTAAALVLLAIVGGGIVATVGFTRAVRAEHAARREADSARRVSDFLVEMFRTSSPDRSRGETITARTILDEGTRRIQSSLKEDPYIRARLLSTLGEVHQYLGMRDKGIALMREGLAVAESSGAPDQLEIATHLYPIARALRLAEPEETGALLDRAIHIAQDAGDAGRSLLIKCLALKAYWYNDQSLRSLADSLVTVCLGMMESTAEQDTQLLIDMLQLQGNIAHNEYRTEDAERLYLRALELSDQTGREPSRSVFLNENLAALYRALGRPDKSMEHAERGLTLARQIFPPNHPTLGWSMRGYSDALYARGDYAKAVEVREQVAEIYRANSSTRSLAFELMFASAIHREMGQYERSIALAEEACELHRNELGTETAQAAEALANLAQTYCEARHFSRADSSYRAAIAVLDRVDPTGFTNGLAYRGYGNVCRETGRLAEAESLYQHAEATFDSTKEGLRAFHGGCLADHALLRSLQGRHEEAEIMMQRGHQLMDKKVGEKDFEMRMMYVTWARARARAGDVDGAIDVLGRAAGSRATAKDVSRFDELASLQSRADFPNELRE